jgi:hypothetical protein
MSDDRRGHGGPIDASIPDRTTDGDPAVWDRPTEHAQELLERIVDPAGRPVIFLFGAALTMQTPVRPGVPGVKGMVAKVRDALGGRGSDAFEKALASKDYGTAYRVGFEKLLRVRGADAVNQVIREAVLEAHEPLDDARRSRALARHPSEHRSQCEDFMEDLNGWHLGPSVTALGEILKAHPSRFRKVLTTNFDPLIEITTRMAGGQVRRTVLARDGSPDQHSGTGTHVVHLHGYWFGDDTLHTDVQLGTPRPRLEAALRRWLDHSLLVILGYGGWDDVLMRSLRAIAGDDGAVPDIAWGFYGSKHGKAESSVVERLGDIGERVQFYEYIDLHLLMLLLRERLRQAEPPMRASMPPIVSLQSSIGEPDLELRARVIGMIRKGVRRSGPGFLTRVRMPDQAIIAHVLQRLKEYRFPHRVTEQDVRWALGEACSVLARPPSMELILRRECPECGAISGEACDPCLHLQRIMSTCRELVQPPPSLSVEHVRDLTSCPTCDSRAGDACHGRRKPRRLNHRARREQAIEIATKMVYDQGDGRR